MKALVLSSGGIDSTTCLGLAIQKYGKENVISASLYYGQKHDKELECARRIAEYYGIRHIEDNVSGVMKYASQVCTLMKGGKEIKHESYEQQIKENGFVDSYVPFRNGLFLSIAAAYAVSLFPNMECEIYYGAHADDAAGNAYADCTPEFSKAIGEAINLGTYNRVKVVSPFIDYTKAMVVRVGLDLQVPYHLTWSCYEGHEKQCGVCGTCRDRKAAFEANGVKDPVEYES